MSSILLNDVFVNSNKMGYNNSLSMNNDNVVQQLNPLTPNEFEINRDFSIINTILSTNYDINAYEVNNNGKLLNVKLIYDQVGSSYKKDSGNLNENAEKLIFTSELLEKVIKYISIDSLIGENNMIFKEYIENTLNLEVKNNIHNKKKTFFLLKIRIGNGENSYLSGNELLDKNNNIFINNYYSLQGTPNYITGSILENDIILCATVDNILISRILIYLNSIVNLHVKQNSIFYNWEDILSYIVQILNSKNYIIHNNLGQPWFENSNIFAPYQGTGLPNYLFNISYDNDFLNNTSELYISFQYPFQNNFTIKLFDQDNIEIQIQ